MKLIGTYACGVATGAPAAMRSGWGATQPCVCDPKQQFLNCKGVALDVPVEEAALAIPPRLVAARRARLANATLARLEVEAEVA